MTQLKSVFHLLAVLLLCLFVMTGFALAQPPGGGNGDQAGMGQMQGGAMGQQGGRGNMQMDQEQMQQMMAQRYQELLGMSDEEWAVIGPYVLKVATLSQSTSTRSSSMRMMMGSRSSSSSSRRQDSQDQGGASTQGQDQSTSQGQRTRTSTRGSQDENLQALETLLEDENATSDEIKAKLSVLRKAREKSKQELAVAQRELREFLTLRQEAILVVQGLLE